MKLIPSAVLIGHCHPRHHGYHAYASQLTLLTGNCVFTGDFNSDLLKSTAFSNDLSECLGFKQHINTATRVKATTISLLDHIYTCNVSVHSTVVAELHLADHYDTCCAVDADSAHKTVRHHLTTHHRSFKHTDLDALIADLKSSPLLPRNKCNSVAVMANHFQAHIFDIWD